MSPLAQFSEQIKNIWQKLSVWQKITLAGIVILFLTVVTTIIFIQRPKMEVLYSGLSQETASAMTAKLQEFRVPYDLVDEGRTILVAADKKYQLRLDLAKEVNLSGVIGFESFNETRFGETDTDKRVRFLVALQGELTRTIEEMNEVESATVHIALPQSSLFIRDEKEATASILLRLKPYAIMSATNVKSIMSFVSHSVEGLKPQNVTVMDVQGNLLSEGIADGASAEASKISANQLALKQQYEKEFAQSILSMLEKMRGAGNAVVRANVDMDFDQIETFSETYGDAVLRSEQIREESSTGSSSPAGGNPADANMAGVSYGIVGSAGNNEHEISEQVRNYEINKTTTTKIVAPGKVMKVSLAVIVDGELTPAEENKIKDAVAMAAGIRSERGDQISVVGMPFNKENTAAMEQALAEREKFERRIELFRLAILPICIMFVFIFLFVTIKRSGIFLSKVPSQRTNIRREITALENTEEEVEISLSPEAMEKKAMEKQIDNLVKTKPEDVAKVVKTWLVEE